MRIESSQKLLLNTDLNAADQSEEKQPKSLENNTVSAQGDSVRVSKYLSNLRANQASQEINTSEISSLKSADIDQIKAKIDSGFYNSPAILEKTTDKILDFYSHQQ